MLPNTIQPLSFKFSCMGHGDPFRRDELRLRGGYFNGADRLRGGYYRLRGAETDRLRGAETERRML